MKETFEGVGVAGGLHLGPGVAPGRAFFFKVVAPGRAIFLKKVIAPGRASQVACCSLRPHCVSSKGRLVNDYISEAKRWFRLLYQVFVI